MAKLKDGSRIYGNVTIDSAAVVTTLNASTVNASSFLMSNGVNLIALSQVASSTGNSAYTQANNAYAAANNSNLKSGGTISGDLTISGNLYLSQNTTLINVSTYQVEDSLIYLASNNEISDTIDIGFVGGKNTGGTYNHTGLARHAADQKWYLFDGLVDEGHQNNIIDVANTYMATLRANIEANSITLVGATVATQANLTLAHNQANAAYGQANTAYSQANAAYGAANTANTNALNAYGAANTANTNALNAYGQANTARTTANSAYAQANSDYQPAVTELAVTNNGTSAYRFDQYGAATDDPTLYIRAGETIAFNLNSAGHPFAIRVSNGGANYDTGLTHVATDGTVSTGSSAQGKVSGKLYWKVPYSLGGNTYVYQCTSHAAMVGNIVIEPDSTVIYAQANAAYTQANNARSDANTTFATINTTFGTTNTTFGTMNTTFGTMNTTFTGNVTGTLKGTKDYVVANTNTNGANTVDLSVSNYFRHVLTAATVTFTFSNAPASGTGQMFSLLLIQDASGSRTPAWANTVYWAGGTAPPATTTANARDLWTFITYDGGSTYWGTLTMKDVR